MINRTKKRLDDFSISEFECLKCGECCRAGYKVLINVKDIKNWKKLEKNELLDHIVINPQCIAINNNINSEDGTTVKRIKKQYKNFNEKIEELRVFIKENHLYYGKNCLRQHIETILPNLKSDPIIIPKNFNIILEGLEYGLEYIIETDVSGKCAFSNLNRCSINSFKPIGCKRFPYTKDNCLRDDELFLSICRGLKR